MSDLETLERPSTNGTPELRPMSLTASTGASILAAAGEALGRATAERERFERVALELRERTGRKMATVAAAIAGALAERDRLQREASEQRQLLERVRGETAQTEAAIAAAVEQRERCARAAEEQRARVDQVLRELSGYDALIGGIQAEHERQAKNLEGVEARVTRERADLDAGTASANADRERLLRTAALHREERERAKAEIAKVQLTLEAAIEERERLDRVGREIAQIEAAIGSVDRERASERGSVRDRTALEIEHVDEALASAAAERARAVQDAAETRRGTEREILTVDAAIRAIRDECDERERGMSEIGEQIEVTKRELLRVEAALAAIAADRETSRFDARHAAAIEGRDRLTREAAQESDRLDAIVREIGQLEAVIAAAVLERENFDRIVREIDRSEIGGVTAATPYQDEVAANVRETERPSAAGTAGEGASLTGPLTESVITSANASAALEIGATPFDGFIREYRDSTIAALATVGRWRDWLPIVLIAFLVAIAIAGLVEAVSGASLSASLLLIAGLLAIGLAMSRR